MAAPRVLNGGADVYSSDGEKVGALDRVILQVETLAATHVVVDIGFLRSGHPIWAGGLGLEYDRVLDIGDIEDASDDRVELRLSADEFMRRPEYTQERFGPIEDPSPGEFDSSDVGQRVESLAGTASGLATVWFTTRLNKAADEREVEAGTPVWREEPHDKIGEVDRLLLDVTTGRAEALVIKRGFLFKHEKVLPVRYVSELMDHAVRVNMTDADIDGLAEYQPASG